MYLRQSTTKTVRLGPALDKTDGVTEETALSPTVEVSKDGGAFAARNSATAVTHDSNGWYAVELNATDTNTVGRLVVKFDDAATHLPVWHEFCVLEEEVYDDLMAGSAVGYLKPATAGRDLVVDAAGLADANAVKVGPTGAGTAQTAGDVIADTNDIQARLPAALSGGRMDSQLGGITAGVDLSATMKASVNAEVDSALDTAVPGSPTADSINERVRDWDDAVILRRFTAQAGNAVSVTLDAGASSVAGFYIPCVIRIVGGTGAGQAGRTGWQYNGTTKVMTIHGTFSPSPNATSVVELLALAPADVYGFNSNPVVGNPSGYPYVHLAGAEDKVITAAKLAADVGTEIAGAVKAVQLTESYAADGVAPTVEQALLQIMQFLHEKAISGTTLTVKKLDGATAAMTFTLSDAANPVSVTRTT